MFRGIFIEGLKASFHNKELEFIGEIKEISTGKEFNRWINRLVSQDWVVYAKAPFFGPAEVINYVGRYTHRTAMADSRILSMDNGIIRFLYKKY